MHLLPLLGFVLYYFCKIYDVKSPREVEVATYVCALA